MNLNERRATLIQQINNISNEETLEMLEETLQYYTGNSTRDITDGLNEYQLNELISLVQEPSEKDTISEEEYRKLLSRWSTK